MKTKFVYSYWTAAVKMNVLFLDSFFPEEFKKAESVQQVTVSKASDRFTRPGFEVHCCEVLEIDPIWVNLDPLVPPEGLYLQLAPKLGPQKTILFGNLLCAHAEGMRPLTTPEKLKAYVSKAKNVKGRRIALRALRFIRGGSRSPMEICLHMLLSNSHLLGGFNLGSALFDYEIVIPVEFNGIVRESSYYADIYYPEHKLIVEYDGAIHSGQKDKDVKRRAILRTLGYEVIVLNKYSLYDLNKFEEVINRILKIVKKRLRIRTPQFVEMFLLLRSLLPSLENREKLSERIINSRWKETLNFLKKIVPYQYFQNIREIKRRYWEAMRIQT